MTDQFPAAIPWYNSVVLRGIVTIVVTQIVSRLQQQYHIDTTVLGFGVNDIVSWIMDVISAGALAYMTHGRVVQKSSPVITASQSAADIINIANPAGAAHATPIVTPDSKPAV